jgi:aquaporin Z
MTPAGRPLPTRSRERPADGWHWPEWTAELTGTALLMFGVVTAKFWCVRAGTPFTLPIVAAVAGLVVIVVAYSPLGRRSGAHLNPAVTLGFWVQGTAGRGDLAGYVAAQTIGGLLGVAAAGLWGPGVTSTAVRWAVITPRPSIGQPTAALIETAAVVLQLAAVYGLLAGRRFQQWTAAVAGALLTAAIVVLAPITGAGFNPVRGIAPDVLATTYPAVWIYLAGPLLGAAVAAATVRWAGYSPRTGKLCHDPAVVCHMRCLLPHS